MQQHPLVTLREVHRGLGLLAREFEDVTGTRPRNLFYWQQELESVIAELDERRWAPTRPMARHETA
jgi:hypothetical protein